jgi:LPS export ABC transporter permease LptG
LFESNSKTPVKVEVRFLKTLCKYVSKEFILPFLIGLVGFIIFVSVELLYQLSDVIVQNHVSFWSLLVLVYYNLPEFIVMGIPVGVLLAIFWEISNFSTRRELMAFQVHGINLKKIVVPFLLMGFILSVGTYLIQDFVVPNYNSKASEYLQKTVWHSGAPQVKTNTFFKAGDSYFYVEKFDPNTEKFNDVLIYEVKGNDFTVTYAKSASFQDGKWVLKDGRIYTLKNGLMNFDMNFKTMKLDITQDIVRFIRSQKTAQSMSSRELLDRIKLFKKLGLDPRIYIVELNTRFANAIGALIIAFLGVPFSLFFGIKSKSWGVIITFILVVLYQGSGAWLSAMGKNGLLPPTLASWAPDLIFAVLGATFFLLLDSRLMFKIKEFFVRVMPILVIIFIFSVGGRVFGSQFFKINAGQLDIVSATEIIYNQGVQVKTENYTVNASSLKIFFDKNGVATLALLEGNVIFTQGEKKIFASSMSIKLQENMAIIDNLHGIEKIKNAKGDKQNVYFYGERSRYDTKSGTSVIEPGYITTCKFNPPHYKIQAQSIYFVPEDHLVAHNLIMYLFGLPILYLPEYYYSLAGGKQPMEVTFNHSTTQGWYTAVKFNFSPSKDLSGGAFFSSYEKGPSSQGFDVNAKLIGIPFYFSYSKTFQNEKISAENVKFGTSMNVLKYKSAFSYQTDVKNNTQSAVLSLNGPLSGGTLSLKGLQSVNGENQKYELPYSIKGLKTSFGNLGVKGELVGNNVFYLPSKKFAISDSLKGEFSLPFRFMTLKSISGKYNGSFSGKSDNPVGYSAFVDANYAFDSLSYKFLGTDLNFSYSAKTGFEKDSNNAELSERFAAIAKTSLSKNLFGVKTSVTHTIVGVGGKNVAKFDTHNFENNLAFSLTYTLPFIPLNANAKFSYNFNNLTNPWSNISLVTSSKFNIFSLANSFKTTTIVKPSLTPINTKFVLDSKLGGVSYHGETLYDYGSGKLSNISSKLGASLGNLLFLSNFKWSSNFIIRTDNFSIDNLNFETSGSIKELGISLSSKGNFSNGALKTVSLNFLKSLDCLGLKGSLSLSPSDGFKVTDFSLTLYITAFPEKYVSVDPVKGNFGFSFF